VWDSKKKIKVSTLISHENEVISLLRVGNFLWSSSFKSILVWDMKSFKCIEEKIRHHDIVKTMILNNGNVWCGSFDGTITVWSAVTNYNISLSGSSSFSDLNNSRSSTEVTEQNAT